MGQLQTVRYEEDGAVAWVTLDRPEVHNAFDTTMQRELRGIWRWLRHRQQVRAIVVTGAGDKAFCTGVDQHEVMASLGARQAGPVPSHRSPEHAVARAGDSTGGAPVHGDTTAGTPPPSAEEDGEPHVSESALDQRRPDELGPVDFQHEPVSTGWGPSPFMYDDPGRNIGPKANDLWKPVIAAVNGMACGGAFYILGEVEFMVAADHATFFDPHLTYGMAAAYEPMQMTGALPFPELVRMTLMGAEERMTAARAHQIGWISEVVPATELRERAAWAATVLARAHPTAMQSTLRALWTARDLGRAQALRTAWSYVSLGDDQQALDEGRQRFSGGQRVPWRSR